MMKYKKIKNIAQYNKYCNRHEKLFEKERAKDIDEIELLEILIEEYENRVSTTKIKDFNPVELLKSMLTSNNLTQVEFSRKLKVSPQLISDILNYRRNISKELVIKFADFFAMTQEAFSRSYELVNAKVIQEYPIQRGTSFSTSKAKDGKGSYRSKKKSPVKKDNLKIIPGIGKKIEIVLNSAGINTVSQLSKTSKRKIKEILIEASFSPQRYNALEWPMLAKQKLVTKARPKTVTK